MSSRVVHCKREHYDVYIGRPSKWGNPFGFGSASELKTREEAISAYEDWIKTQPQLLDSLGELKDKVLGCWCSPRPCHGDVLIRLVKGEVVPDG